MSFIVRPIIEEERAEFVRASISAFQTPAAEDVVAQGVDRAAKRAAPERFLAAFNGTRIVSTSFSFPTALTLPEGRELDIAWIAAVTTLPSHRRRGLMTEVLTTQLQALRGEGLAIAGLSSFTSHYRRFGFGPAAASVDMHFDGRRDLLDAERWDGPVDFTQRLDRDGLAELHERFRASCVGEIGRDEAWWDFSGRQDRGNVYLRNTDGTIAGWAAYRIRTETRGTEERSLLDVEDFVAVDPRSRRALWNVVLGFDTADRISVRFLPTDDPIMRMLRHPTDVDVVRRESPWLRALDVARALTARTYRSPFALTVRVHDPLFVANDSTFRLEVDGAGAASCEPSPHLADRADLAMDVADLAPLLTGHTTVRQLAAAGRLTIHDEQAATAAGSAFAVERPPFCSLFMV